MELARTRSGTPIVRPFLVLIRILGELSLQDGVDPHVITNDVYSLGHSGKMYLAEHVRGDLRTTVRAECHRHH